MAKLSWEQEARAAGEILAYHRALALSPPHEGRIHTLSEMAGRLLFAHMGEDTLHQVFHVVDLVSDEARFEPIRAADRGKTTNIPEDPQGKPSIHLQLHTAITAYGDHHNGKPRFMLLGGAFERSACADLPESSQDFFSTGKRWEDYWVLPGMANALRRIVLLDWQALGGECRRNWAKSIDPERGRVARLAFAGYLFQAAGGDGQPNPNMGKYGTPMGAGLDLSGRDRRRKQGILGLTKGEDLEAWWNRIRADFQAPDETWSYKQVSRVVQYSKGSMVQVPKQFLPLEHLTDPSLRNLSLMQALTHHLCDSAKGPRITPSSAAQWLNIPPSQVRTHLSRARAKLGTSPSVRKAPTGAHQISGPARAGTGGDEDIKE
jgi:hypothetical protein